MSAAHALESAFLSWRVARFATVDSTNEEARRLALAGDPGRLWVVADEQTAGRGRRGRAWVSPKGNLYASALLIDPCPPAIAPELGFVAGVALVRAANDVGAIDVGLKWPNDLVSNGAKCAGLLIEGVNLSHRRVGYIVGVGVNCESAPAGPAYSAACLANRSQEPIDPRALLQSLIERFAEALGQWRDGEAFDVIRTAWLADALGLGQRISIEAGGRRREGVFEGLDPHGRLLFASERGLETIEAADLWLLPASGVPSGAALSAAPWGEGRA